MLCYTVHMNKEDIEEILRLKSLHHSMVYRCHYPSHFGYADYGGRGIKVCDEWRSDAAEFIIWALKNNTVKGLHLDRIDNDGDYSPDNCHFVSPKVNGRNRRNTIWATAFGETKPLGAWMEDERCVVAYPTLHARLKNGWDAEKAISTPSTRTNNRSTNE